MDYGGYTVHFFLFVFVFVNNIALFQVNSEVHSINTGYNSNFHVPHVNLTAYKNGTCYTDIKIFN